MRKKRKKRAVTLIEIMIVILLIGLIGGALAFNMRGSMDQGKVFKTKQNIARVQEALMMEYAQGTLSLQEVVDKRVDILRKSPLVKDPSAILNDGWGRELSVNPDAVNDEILVTSEMLTRWENAQNRN